MPTPRPRVVVRGKFPTVYHPKEYTAWKDSQAESVRGVNNLPPLLFLDRPVEVEMTVRVAKPKTSKLTHPSPDVDNYAKGVLDAISQSERWWGDDRQVTDLTVRKRWAAPEEAPGVEVTITYT